MGSIRNTKIPRTELVNGYYMSRVTPKGAEVHIRCWQRQGISNQEFSALLRQARADLNAAYNLALESENGEDGK